MRRRCLRHAAPHAVAASHSLLPSVLLEITRLAIPFGAQPCSSRLLSLLSALCPNLPTLRPLRTGLFVPRLSWQRASRGTLPAAAAKLLFLVVMGVLLLLVVVLLLVRRFDGRAQSIPLCLRNQQRTAVSTKLTSSIIITVGIGGAGQRGIGGMSSACNHRAPQEAARPSLLPRQPRSSYTRREPRLGERT
jgi:hypothetical protein